MKRAILMTRVSSDEQAKGYSLGDQEDRLIKYCHFHNIEIVEIYKEDHSAKDFNRPEWKNIYNHIKREHKKIDFLLFTSWDRFSRNIAEAYQVIKNLQKYSVIPQAVEQPIDFSIPENKAMLAFYLAIPEIDNDRRSIKITGGIRKAWKSGRWTHPAPKGYKNSRDEENKPIIIPHKEYSKIIKKIFKSIANDTSTQAELVKEANKKGLKMSKSQLSRLLSNPVYMGKIRVPAYEDEPEYFSQGIHEPLVSEDLFYKVQNKLNVKREEKNKATKITKVREELPLRGHLQCSCCGEIMTGSASRGKLGTRYFYYHCNKCKKERLRADLVNKQTIELLKELTFDEDVQSLYNEIVKDVFESKGGNKTTDIKKLRGSVKLIDERLKKAQMLLIDGAIDVDDYQSMKGRFEGEKLEIENKIKIIKSTSSNFESYLNQGIGIITNLYKYYISANIREKQKILGSIFPGNLIFTKNEVRTPRINSVIVSLLLKFNDLHNKKTGRFFLKPDLLHLVERPGFEPGVPFRVRQFSKLVVSATHPPLRCLIEMQTYEIIFKFVKSCLKKWSR